METLCQELGIPRKQIKETKRLNRFIVVAHKNWLKCLVQENNVEKFPIHPGFEEWPNNEENIGQDWSLAYFTVTFHRFVGTLIVYYTYLICF